MSQKVVGPNLDRTGIFQGQTGTKRDVTGPVRVWTDAHP